MSLSQWAAGKGVTLILPDGIQMGSSYDEGIDAYVQADEELRGNSFITLTYGVNHNKVELSFAGEPALEDDIYVAFINPA